jgi:hypothetical protein
LNHFFNLSETWILNKTPELLRAATTVGNVIKRNDAVTTEVYVFTTITGVQLCNLFIIILHGRCNILCHYSNAGILFCFTPIGARHKTFFCHPVHKTMCPVRAVGDTNGNALWVRILSCSAPRRKGNEKYKRIRSCCLMHVYTVLLECSDFVWKTICTIRFVRIPRGVEDRPMKCPSYDGRRVRRIAQRLKIKN